jgi:hypothetical protein
MVSFSMCECCQTHSTVIASTVAVDLLRPRRETVSPREDSLGVIDDLSKI